MFRDDNIILLWYLSFHSGRGLGRQLIPEHVHLSHRSLRLMRLLVQLLTYQLHFVLDAQRRQRDPVAFRRFSHGRAAVHFATVLNRIKQKKKNAWEQNDGVI